MRRYGAFLLFGLSGVACAQTTPIAPNIQEAPMPPPVALPAPDALPADVAREITAADAARIALRYQQSLKVSEAGALAAHGRTREARASLNPTLSVSASYSRSEVFKPASGVSSSSGSGGGAGYATSISARQLLFDFDHALTAARQASALEDAALSDFARAHSDLVFSVKQSFYTLLQNSNLVKVNVARSSMRL